MDKYLLIYHDENGQVKQYTANIIEAIRVFIDVGQAKGYTAFQLYVQLNTNNKRGD
jgi:hypothetical protein